MHRAEDHVHLHPWQDVVDATGGDCWVPLDGASPERRFEAGTRFEPSHRSFDTRYRRRPQQLIADPGDAVLCHYQLGHGIGGNSSPHIRYAIYFRLSHIEHDANHWECMTDIWREWDGMRDVLGAQRA